MRGFFLFVVGIGAGLVIESAVAQSPNRGIVGLNHVALSVPDGGSKNRPLSTTLGPDCRVTVITT